MKTLLFSLLGVSMLLIAACSTHHRNDALLVASGNGDLEAVKRLVASGADVNYTSNTGRHFTPLLFATSQRQYAVAKFLIEHGGDPNIGDVESKPSIFYALGEADADADMVDFLLKHGASLAKVQNEAEFFGARNQKLLLILDAQRKPQ